MSAASLTIELDSKSAAKILAGNAYMIESTFGATGDRYHYSDAVPYTRRYLPSGMVRIFFRARVAGSKK